MVPACTEPPCSLVFSVLYCQCIPLGSCQVQACREPLAPRPRHQLLSVRTQAYLQPGGLHASALLVLPHQAHGVNPNPKP